MKTNKTWKILAFFLILMLTMNAVPATAVYSQASGPQTSPTEIAVTAASGSSQFLPIVTVTRNTVSQNTYLPAILKACIGYDSPFSIQIAGLSDIYSVNTSGLQLSPAEQETQQAQAMAELDAAFPSMVEALRKSGAGWARVYIDWATIEPAKGTFNWAWYDKKLALIAASGAKIIATVSNPPQWAWKQEVDPCINAVKDPQDFYNFMSALVDRYKNRYYNDGTILATISIHDWEILNEPDAIPGYRCDTGVMAYGYLGPDYANLVQSASAVIKNIDPTAKVIMGGIAYDWFTEYNGNFVRAFVGDVMTTTGGAGMDALNFHYFRDFRAEWERWSISNDAGLPFAKPTPPVCWPGGPSFPVDGPDVAAKLTYFKNQMSVCYNVNKPIYISEIGHHGAAVLPPGVDPNIDPTVYDLDYQARYVFEGNARALAYGATNVTWYALKIVRAMTPVDEQGLLDDAGNPKKAFWTYQTLTRELTGYKYNRTLNWGWYAESYVFNSPCGPEKTMAWVNPDRFTGVLTPQAINFPAGKLRLVYRPDMDANFQPIPHVVTITDGGAGDLDGVVNGSVRFELNIEPVIIEKLQ